MRESAETVGGREGWESLPKQWEEGRDGRRGEGEQHATIHHIQAAKDHVYSFSVATVFSVQTWINMYFKVFAGILLKGFLRF